MKGVSRTIKKWKVKLFLQEWKIEVSFPKSDPPFPPNDYPALAEIDANPVYLQAHIRVFPIFFKQTKEDQEATLVHELCHCHSQAIYNLLSRQAEGRIVTRDQMIETLEVLTQRMANIAQS